MRTKSEFKRQAILDAALANFRDNGYETTSMAGIAARAGASKATLYAYFPSKEALFMAVIIEAGVAHGDAAITELGAGDDLRTSLLRLGERHLRFLTRPETVAMERIAIMEGARSTLGQAFYARGPGALLERLAAWLEAPIASGMLRAGEPRWMAEHLKALYEAGIIERRLFGSAVALDQAHLAACVARAVDVFLAYYGNTRT